MPYLILFIVIFIFMGFSLVFQWLLKDNLRHLYIVGLTLFYALCTLIRRSPAAARYIGNITNGWALVIYAFFIMMSVWCAVSYVMHIIPDYKFRATMGVFMLSELIVFIITAVFRYYNIHFYLQVFFICILVIGITSVVLGIYYAIINWKKIQYYDKIMLIATFCMIFWFMSSLVFNLQDAQYVYICGTGIVLYFLAYITVSAIRLHHQIYKNHPMNNAANTNEQLSANPFSNITHNEKMLLDIMTDNNTTNTKEILNYLPSDTSENSINTALSRLMKKADIKTREELIELWSAGNEA